MKLSIFSNSNIFTLLISFILISIAVNISYQKSSNLLLFMNRPITIFVSLILNILLFRYDIIAGYAFFLLLIMLYSNVQNIEIINEHFNTQDGSNLTSNTQDGSNLTSNTQDGSNLTSNSEEQVSEEQKSEEQESEAQESEEQESEAQESEYTDKESNSESE